MYVIVTGNIHSVVACYFVVMKRSKLGNYKASKNWTWCANTSKGQQCRTKEMWLCATDDCYLSENKATTIERGAKKDCLGQCSISWADKGLIVKRGGMPNLI